MQRIRQKYIWYYAALDYFAAFLAWFLLYFFRKIIIEHSQFNSSALYDKRLYIGLLIVPQFWMLLHFISGTYYDIFRKSRLQEFFKTFAISLIGSVVLFFSLILDDQIKQYADYYFTFLFLFLTQFLITYSGRYFLLRHAKKLMREGTIFYPTLIVGEGSRATSILADIKRKNLKQGLDFKGFISIGSPILDKREINHLAELKDLEKTIDKLQIEEVIIALENEEKDFLTQILDKLAGKNVHIKILPEMINILSGNVRMNHLQGEAFIEIPPHLLSESQRIQKRIFDLFSSAIALIVSSPLLIYVAIQIKLSSKGPVFYTQERLGLHGKPFQIFKFRSMYVNAEEAGPQLTTDNDARITPIGKWIRQYRIDEFPQFVNVLIGDMSIVGPRAERKYFADKILEEAPYFKHVWKVKPGITSLGMVNYGYASTVPEMVQRLKYDMIYIENISVLMDTKILIYTVLTVLYGKGK